MEMTRERLEAYKSEKQEIEELRYKLNHIKAEDYTGNDVIMDYNTGFPRPQSVVGTDINAYWRRKDHLQAEISRLERRCQETEQWISQITDSLTRRIFRMYFEEGKNQKSIAKILHMDQSNISKKIDKYLSI